MGFDHLVSVGLTDIGRRRGNNEDSLLLLDDSGVYCVADGMGGVDKGEVASMAAVESLAEAFSGRHSDGNESYDLTVRLVHEAAVNANAWIGDYAHKHGSEGMGTTIVTLVFDRDNPARALALHAGDSRLYRLRDRQLTQITTDHSLAAEAGLENEDSLGPMFQAMVTRAIGVQPDVELEETDITVEPGDTYLICSDGLSGMLSDFQIADILRLNPNSSLDELARLMVDRANENGGNDNITVILIRDQRELDPAADSPAAEPDAKEPETVDESEPSDTAETHDNVESSRDDSQEVFSEPPTADADKKNAPEPDSSEPVFDSHDQAVPSDSDIVGVTPTSGQSTPTATPEKRPEPSLSSKRLSFPAVITGIAVIVLVIFLFKGCRAEEEAIPVAEPTTDEQTEPLAESASDILAESLEPDTYDPEPIEPEPVTPDPEPEPIEPEPIEPEPIELEPVELEPVVIPEPAAPEPEELAEELDLMFEEPEPEPEPDPILEVPELDETEEPSPDELNTLFEEPDTTAEETAQSMKATLPMRINSTLLTGEWGHMEEHIAKWSQTIDDYLSDDQLSTVYFNWLRQWTKIRDGMVDGAELCNKYHSVAADLCTRARFDPPPSIDDVWEQGKPAAIADVSCRNLYNMQKHVIDNVTDFVLAHQAETEVFGANPKAVLMPLWDFVGETNLSIIARYVTRSSLVAKDLNHLDLWLQDCGESPIYLESIRRTPAVIVPRIQIAMTAQRTAIFHRALEIRNHISAWNHTDSEELTNLLTEIEELYVALFGNGTRPDNQFWLEQKNQDNLKKLLQDIEAVTRMDRADGVNLP